MRRYVGGLDQGTTSTRFMIFDHQGKEIARHQKEHEQILPQSGWVEHDPIEIIRNSEDVITLALQNAHLNATDLAAFGLTNQRETTVAWNRTNGIPYYNAIVWQDTRTAEIAERLKASGQGEMIRNKTGLPPSTYFSATKMQWLMENVPDIKKDSARGVALFGNIDTWLIWNLTGGPNGGIHITDLSNASRTMLMNLKTLAWDPELLSIFGIPIEMLPQIRSSADFYADAVAFRIPICSDLGDQQAAMVGQVCLSPGEAKNTYGTGNFMLLNTGTNRTPSPSGLLTTVCYRFRENPAIYALEGSVAVTGSAVQWLRDQLGMITDASEIEALALRVPDNGGMYFVPAFSGLFAPYWRNDARGAIVGLSRFHTREHFARATLEAICFQTKDVLDAMVKDSGVSIQVLKVDGGATVNNTLMQLQADILGVRVERPVVRETTALGAAYAAGLTCGYWKDTEELRQNWQVDQSWEPHWSADHRESLYNGWKKAVQRTLDWL